MMNIKKKMKESKLAIAHEYAKVNANPIVKAIVQASVMIIDIVIMFVLIWNVFAYCLPDGAWLNIVSGSSMEPNMHNGQVLFTDNSEITRGDVVTSRVTDYGISQDINYKDMVIIKRVIGVPGDRLIINENGIYINGELLVEDYIPIENQKETYKEGNCNSVLLGENEYFLLGDNRGASADSRVFGVFKNTDIMYKQSTEPTTNFYVKLLFILAVFALDIFLYTLVEFVLTESAYFILYHKKLKSSTNEPADDDNDNFDNTDSKGEE